ncbi:MAG: parB-like partition protein, partial [Firmicutes bacterium]|nr:parB-like partition protein [Bacillota bacterium]
PKPEDVSMAEKSAVSEEELSNVQEIAVDSIVPNPYQPRKLFDDEALQELAASIREFGIIQPLLVRPASPGYELIAGERRLRAAKLAQLAMVPAIVKNFSDKEAAELAMIENLQREDLHYLDEALGFQQLLANFGFTQEELARRVGKNQSTIANKLRLLKLTDDVRKVILETNLTERHARALLKLDDEKQQFIVLQDVQAKKLNVRETEELVERVVQQAEPAKPKQNIVRMIKDVRIFLNTIHSVINQMKKAGMKIKVEQTQDDKAVYLKLKIPKR